MKVFKCKSILGEFEASYFQYDHQESCFCSESVIAQYLRNTCLISEIEKYLINVRSLQQILDVEF